MVLAWHVNGMACAAADQHSSCMVQLSLMVQRGCSILQLKLSAENIVCMLSIDANLCYAIVHCHGMVAAVQFVEHAVA